MSERQAAIDELYRRGEIDDNQKAAYDEMIRRETAPKEKSSTTIDFATSFNRPFERIAEGLLSPIFESGALGENQKQNFDQLKKSKENDFNAAQQNSPTATAWGEGAGDFAKWIPTFAMGGWAPFAAKAAMPIAKTAANYVARTATAPLLAGAGMQAASDYGQGNLSLERTLEGGGIPALANSVLPLAAKGAGKIGKATYDFLKPKVGDTLAKTAVAGEAGLGAGGVADAITDEDTGFTEGLATTLPALYLAGKGVKVASKIGKDTLKTVTGYPQEAIKDDVLYGLSPESMAENGVSAADIQSKLAQTLKTKRAGDKLGYQLTPAEASGSQVAAKTQGMAGKTQGGSVRMENFNDGRQASQQKIVGGILDDISPSGSDYERGVRDVATKYISKKEKELQKLAEPYYKSSKEDVIPDTDFNKLMESRTIYQAFRDVLKNKPFLDEIAEGKPNQKSVINIISKNIDREIRYSAKAGDTQRFERLQRAKSILTSRKNINANIENSELQSVLKELQNDPIFAISLQGVNPSSINMLNQVKIVLDGKIGQAIKSGNKGEARSLKIQLDKLKRITDKASPNYKMARSIYSEGSPGLKAIRDSDLGTISKLADKDLQKASQIIFDKADRNMAEFTKLRDAISSESPETWAGMVRNYLERKLDTARVDKTGKVASAFYNSSLATANDFSKLLVATRNMPEARKKLIYAKRAFRDLIDQPTAVTSAGQGATDMNLSREPIRAISLLIQNMLGGRYDNAVIDVITNPKWDSALKPILNMKDGAPKNSKFLEFLDSHYFPTKPAASTVTSNQVPPQGTSSKNGPAR
jgi:hypothetical protein